MRNFALKIFVDDSKSTKFLSQLSDLDNSRGIDLDELSTEVLEKFSAALAKSKDIVDNALTDRFVDGGCDNGIDHE